MDESIKTLTALIVEPGRKPYTKEISDTLKSLQHEVGGWIEAVYPFPDPVALICNEEGKLDGLPLNRALRDDNGEIYDIVSGTFLVVGLEEDAFRSLTPEELKHFDKLFESPEIFVRLNGKIISIPVREQPDGWMRDETPAIENKEPNKKQSGYKKLSLDGAAAKIKQIAESFSDPAAYAEMVAFKARFHQYSARNAELIYAQNPGASFLASYKRFSDMGWQVQQGQHGLKILAPAPVTFYKDPKTAEWRRLREADKATAQKIKAGGLETRQKMSFKLGTVFDISQTDCPPEQYPRLISVGQCSELHHAAAECLISFCEEKLHCPVQLADLQSVTLRGQYSPSEHRILLNDRLNDTQLISTLAHEMGHAMLHTLPEARELSAAQREIEADTVSILLAGHLGIDIPLPRKEHLASSWASYLEWRDGQIENGAVPEQLPDGEQIIDRASRVLETYSSDLEEYLQGLLTPGIELSQEQEDDQELEP